MAKTGRGGARKPHRKSRNGCSQCRQARIKCDEQAPRCNHCVRRSLQCDFENESTRSRTLAPPWVRRQHVFDLPAPETPEYSSSAVTCPQRYTSVTNPEYPRLVVMVYEPSANSLDFEEARIFHHFVAETSKTFMSSDIPDAFWNFEIPRLALQNGYLLNAVLAISALHKSHLEHSNNLLPLDVNKSIAWHHKSVEAFAHMVANITPENCVPAFAMAAISALYSCGLAQLLSSLQEREHIEQLINIILAMHRAMHLFQPFAPFLKTQGVLLPGQTNARPLQDIAAVLADTAARLSACELMSQVDVSDRVVYEEAIAAFRDSDVSERLTKLPPQFLDLLRDKAPMAILILAAFSISEEQEAKTTPWYLSLWRFKFQEYFIEFLGSIWTRYIGEDEDAGGSSLTHISAAAEVTINEGPRTEAQSKQSFVESNGVVI
ncbi:hypothetical protein EJ04DRAFT_134137 [Polyplosphaeria fusca]|uniref:Zn(2)-C6 fungal-type domain-containing protein n=1 Tax=Polyplosphaeria fusca TaxID=682080 RepID=A0A9P4QMG9_9PLEO|nr:hypothetical protein EJ04DRAFT_134137 [Polyplosphaeria fusca]